MKKSIRRVLLEKEEELWTTFQISKRLFGIDHGLTKHDQIAWCTVYDICKDLGYITSDSK